MMRRSPTQSFLDWLVDVACKLLLYLLAGIFGILVVLFIIGLVVSSRAPSPLDDSALRQQYDTAEVDVRVARKLFEQGRRKEAEEYLSKAEDKAWRCEQGGVAAAALSKVKGGADQVASAHAAVIAGIRKERARARLASRAEAMRSALKALEYRNQVWGEVLSIVQERVRRQADGAEASVESPFRVEPGALREALERRFGKPYLLEMERTDPGVVEKAVQDAEALAEKAGEGAP